VGSTREQCSNELARIGASKTNRGTIEGEGITAVSIPPIFFAQERAGKR
jgi:hypothetical protein